MDEHSARNQTMDCSCVLPPTGSGLVCTDGVSGVEFEEFVMGRIRTIKPEFPQSESMGRVSRDARLLFIQLWTLCDDHGRTRGSSRVLASLLYPYDDDAKGLIDGWIDELVGAGCVLRYTVDDQSYIEVCKWLTHQKIDRPSKPVFPSPREPSRALRKNSPRTKDQGPRTKDQGPRTKDQGPPSSTGVDGFVEFWAAYPRKVGKADAVKTWGKIKPDPETVKDIITAIAVQSESEQWTKHNGQFIPHPATWLNGRRWEDEAQQSAGASDIGRLAI